VRLIKVRVCISIFTDFTKKNDSFYKVLKGLVMVAMDTGRFFNRDNRDFIGDKEVFREVLNGIFGREMGYLVKRILESDGGDRELKEELLGLLGYVRDLDVFKRVLDPKRLEIFLPYLTKQKILNKPESNSGRIIDSPAES